LGEKGMCEEKQNSMVSPGVEAKQEDSSSCTAGSGRLGRTRTRPDVSERLHRKREHAPPRRLRAQRSVTR